MELVPRLLKGTPEDISTSTDAIAHNRKDSDRNRIVPTIYNVVKHPIKNNEL